MSYTDYIAFKNIQKCITYVTALRLLNKQASRQLQVYVDVVLDGDDLRRLHLKLRTHLEGHFNAADFTYNPGPGGAGGEVLL